MKKHILLVFCLAGLGSPVHAEIIWSWGFDPQFINANGAEAVDLRAFIHNDASSDANLDPGFELRTFSHNGVSFESSAFDFYRIIAGSGTSTPQPSFAMNLAPGETGFFNFVSLAPLVPVVPSGMYTLDNAALLIDVNGTIEQQFAVSLLGETGDPFQEDVPNVKIRVAIAEPAILTIFVFGLAGLGLAS